MHQVAELLVGNEDAAMIVPVSPNNIRQRELADHADEKELKDDRGTMPRKQPGLTESNIPDTILEGWF